MITTAKFNYQPHDSELERASNSYLMSLVAVIGGLITSTILSLVVIPPVFTIMDDFEHLMGRFWRFITGNK